MHLMISNVYLCYIPSASTASVMRTQERNSVGGRDFPLSMAILPHRPSAPHAGLSFLRVGCKLAAYISGGGDLMGSHLRNWYVKPITYMASKLVNLVIYFECNFPSNISYSEQHLFCMDG